MHSSRDCFELRCQQWTKDGKKINVPRSFYFANPKGHIRGQRSSSGMSTNADGTAFTQDSSHWVFMIKLSIQRTQLEDLRAKHCALDPDLLRW